MFDQGINQKFGFDNSVVGNNNVIENDLNVDVNMMAYNNDMVQNAPIAGNPVNEPVQERVVERTIMHEVPQV